MTNKQRWFLIAAMWAIILALAFVFYWLQIRPLSIRKMCAQKANEASKTVKSDIPNLHEIYRAIYSDCCRNNGIKE